MTNHEHEENPSVDTPADAAAAGNNRRPGALDGNEAVNLAAEQSKSTAHRNIPPLNLDELPVPDDTANLRHGPSLNDALLALLPLVGVWRGEGQAIENGEEFAFGQQIIFAHDGEDYLTYESRLWRLDENGQSTGPDQRETGFWRISARDEIEVITCLSTGAVEIMYGKPYNERAWEISSASTMVTEQGPKNLGPGKRLFGLMPNNNLGWVDERADDTGELSPHLSAQLKRIAG
ncbi:FABP family protein [Corynebacterium yudongzhengii]|uniref:Peroxynitrite isomerase n=1 Tax=Corynebacterium yudongzhengii TaxID=2080740 RepID=A0A2U1T5M6_9CORY|nr:FABP family protein [Corynebacterium yudongzhengii]AWB82586.1 FABP family protein [Corynebacterium yudongzhengii]PWC01320.1 FABP family protein [Corynebacterium yudongzhengii]